MRRPPGWMTRLLRSLAPPDHVEDVLGDLEEAHRHRSRRHSIPVAHALTAIETLDMAAALLRSRAARFRTNKGNAMLQDFKLGGRMLAKYPGLTVAGGLALAIAIGIGAAWYDFSQDLFRPTLRLPGGDRIVEIELRNSLAGGDERRLSHEFQTWRAHLQLIEDLGAYRTLDRNLIVGSTAPDPVTVAETTASAFRVAGVPPSIGRTLLDGDEQPGAPPVVVLGYDVWQRRFGGSADVIGRTLQLGRETTTIVGVMPEGFAFPVNHRMWTPLRLRSSGYAPLEGPPIRVFGRLAPGATQAQAGAEVDAVHERVAAASPRTHEHLRPRVLAYGGESPGDRTLLELTIRHLPILLVLIVACANVGTLIYARTATREAEIAMRYALGASRGRIVAQLFIEALVLASVAAVVGLTAANWALKWGTAAYYSGQSRGMPFWIDPGLKLTTVLFSAVITITGAALLSLLPALKVTGARVQSELRNLGSGGSTLRFGGVWTAAMIAQVAITVVLIPPAIGISEEAVRDRIIRARFPAQEYLSVEVALDQEQTQGATDGESMAAYAARFEQVYQELERRIAQEPGVIAVGFGDRLPGMDPTVRTAELEVPGGAAPLVIPNLWSTAVGPRFFELFDRSVVTGRDFHNGDRTAGARTVLVNEAFARRFGGGSSPVGRRVRNAAPTGGTETEPWFEIVGVVRDMGMTPTDLGEAPYIYQPATPATVTPLVMGIRSTGDPVALASRVRSIAAALDPGLGLGEIRSLDDLVRREETPMMVMFTTIIGVVSLGLFLSAAGIFSLMSVSVARRTREIGLRAALGATPARLLAGIFSRAIVLIGSGVVAGNAILLLFVILDVELNLRDVALPLLLTSAVMLTVGFLACVEPARRALKIDPTDALKES